MAQKYYNVQEAAKVLGIEDAEVKQMLDRRELHGYRDGADWKFKVEDIEQLAKTRAAAPSEAEGADVLLNEHTLGQSDTGASGTVIGMEAPGAVKSDSDIHLAGSDVRLADAGASLAASDPRPAPAGGSADALDQKVSQFEDLDLTLDQDVKLEDSGLHGEAAKAASDVDLAGKKLDDDDLVLGGSGAGSDITIGGDSGISLVDPSDSGLSLEEPLSVGPGEESLELGEDDMLALSTDAAPGSGLKSDDEFQLTPMAEIDDPDDSESGSQVIALDTESDEAPTMIASTGASSMAAMLDEDLSLDSTMSLSSDFGAGMGEIPLGMQPVGLAAGVPVGQPAAAALPEAPYNVWNVISLILCSLLLMVTGMLMYDVMEHMRSWDSPHYITSPMLDSILGMFEK